MKASSCNKWPIMQRVKTVSQSSDGPNVSMSKRNSSEEGNNQEEESASERHNI